MVTQWIQGVFTYKVGRCISHASSVTERIIDEWESFFGRGNAWIRWDFFMTKWFPFGLANIFMLPASSFRMRSSDSVSAAFFMTRILTPYPYHSSFVSTLSFHSLFSQRGAWLSSHSGTRNDISFRESEIGRKIQPIQDQKWRIWSRMKSGIIWLFQIPLFSSPLHTWSWIGEKSKINHPTSSFGSFESALVSHERGSTESFSVRSFKFA